MKLLLIIFLSLFIGCSSAGDRLKAYEKRKDIEDKTYYITCQTLDDKTAKTYSVSYAEYNVAYGSRSGMWNFKTIKGKRIKSSLCHSEN